MIKGSFYTTVPYGPLICSTTSLIYSIKVPNLLTQGGIVVLEEIQKA